MERLFYPLIVQKLTTSIPYVSNLMYFEVVQSVLFEI